MNFRNPQSYKDLNTNKNHDVNVLPDAIDVSLDFSSLSPFSQFTWSNMILMTISNNFPKWR